MKKKQQGFNMIELMLALTIGATLATTAVMYYNKQKENSSYENQKNNLNSFAKNVINYINANQAAIYNSSDGIKTINTEQLQYFKYINNSNQYLSHDYKTGSTLYPCVSLNLVNGSLKGFAYYRTDDVKLSLNGYIQDIKNNINDKNLRISSAINSLGADGAILTVANNNYILKAANGSWQLDSNFINNNFIQTGQDFLGIVGVNMSCKGQYIVTPSIVISMNNYLMDVNTQVKTDNTVQQNNNNLVTSNSNNDMNNLNLDSTVNIKSNISNKNQSRNSSLRNSLVFQTNNNCQMNPALLSTMQDYDPKYPDASYQYQYQCPSTFDPNNVNCSQFTQPNKYGCRNKQLSLSYSAGQRCTNEVINQQTGVATCESFQNVDNIVTTGFDQTQTSLLNQSLNLGSYLGGLKATSIQPTAEVQYGTSCSIDEVGAMAKQAPASSADDNLYNKILAENQGVLVCQKSPLCGNGVGSTITSSKLIGACWLPTTKMRIELDFDPSQKILSFEAPSGFAIVNTAGNEVTYTKDSSLLNDVRTYNDGAKGAAWVQVNLERGHTSYGTPLTNTTCQHDVCDMNKPWPFKGCLVGKSSRGYLTRQTGFQISSNQDYLYFYNSYLNQNKKQNWKGFTVFVDSNDGNNIDQNNLFMFPNVEKIVPFLNPGTHIVTYSYAGHWNADRGVFKWIKNCHSQTNVHDERCELIVSGGVSDEPTYPWTGNAVNMVANKYALSNGYPKATNAMFTLRSTFAIREPRLFFKPRADGCNGFMDAIGYGTGNQNGWYGDTPKVLMFPHYITKVVISNDPNELVAMDSLPPAPPQPSVTCDATKIDNATKNQLLASASADRVYSMDGVSPNYVYVNPTSPNYNYTSELSDGGFSCKASLYANNCTITDNNACKYIFDFSIESSVENLNYIYATQVTKNSVPTTLYSDWEVFSGNQSTNLDVSKTGENVFIGAFDQSKNLVGYMQFSGKIGEAYTSFMKQGATYNLNINSKYFGAMSLMQVPLSCNQSVSCSSPEGLKNILSGSVIYNP